ncbi:hypothetical protein RJT34_18268 [Clitoria ternatea]|uniref:Uncharacterized protein n=1 Tax=Clitoria ternatea TaxID=43366 RepID=A0AAN9JBS4_CLITE
MFVIDPIINFPTLEAKDKDVSGEVNSLNVDIYGVGFYGVSVGPMECGPVSADLIGLCVSGRDKDVSTSTGIERSNVRQRLMHEKVSKGGSLDLVGHGESESFEGVDRLYCNVQGPHVIGPKRSVVGIATGPNLTSVERGSQCHVTGNNNAVRLAGEKVRNVDVKDMFVKCGLISEAQDDSFDMNVDMVGIQETKMSTIDDKVVGL